MSERGIFDLDNENVFKLSEIEEELIGQDVADTLKGAREKAGEIGLLSAGENEGRVTAFGTILSFLAASYSAKKYIETGNSAYMNAFKVSFLGMAGFPVFGGLEAKFNPKVVRVDPEYGEDPEEVVDTYKTKKGQY